MTWGSKNSTNRSTNSRSFGDDVSDGGSEKKGKVKTIWVCESCGYSNVQQMGACRSCYSVGKMKAFVGSDYGGEGETASGCGVSEKRVRTWLEQQSGDAGPVRLTDVNRGVDQKEWLIPLPGLLGNEVATVLGGGLVPGSLVLVGGDPGVGKSTLLLQIAAIIAKGYEMSQSAPVVYVSGEESVEQIKNRADRMNIGTEEILLYTSTDVEDILKEVRTLSPRALIVDSIQTVYLKGVAGSPGGTTQVKACMLALHRFAKKAKIPVFFIGHVNKSGGVAGPRVLEHIVDAVLYLEGEKHSSHRFLRPVKNRFGSTDELGVFEMSQSGLQAVLNPSEIFLSEPQRDSEVLAGLAVALIMLGSRFSIINVQALCVAANEDICSTKSLQVTGFDKRRAHMIVTVLITQVGLKLQKHFIFLNVVGGLTLKGTSGDLAVAVAICSSFLEFSIPPGVAFIAEIGLGGELRKVPQMEKRVITVAKLGYNMCFVPSSAAKFLSDSLSALHSSAVRTQSDSESALVESNGMKILGCWNLEEVIKKVFR